MIVVFQDTTYHKAIALLYAEKLKGRDQRIFYGFGFMMCFNSTPPENPAWKYHTEFEVESCWWAYVWILRPIDEIDS